uniref:AAA+ ATPase domain-containing protein n=2 Tax=Oryza brachyantha TaxID=4533 RepID=J3N8Z6_ORYBR
MGALLPKLADLLKEEYQLQKRARGEVMWLTRELESMRAALLKVSDQGPIDQPPDAQVKLWATNVRDLSYDIEDSIDRFMVRIDTPMVPDNPHGFFRGFVERSLGLMSKAKIRRSIGVDIRQIKSRINEEKERHDRYSVVGGRVVAAKPVAPTVDSLRLSTLYKESSKLVGLEEKTGYLVRKLMEVPDDNEGSSQQLNVVSVVGFGGLGKTTLANVVYKELRAKFDCGAFVSISLSPNMVGIFKKMLRQLDEIRYQHINGETWDEVQLIDELRKFLRNKRYIVVIDDIWNISVWKTIKYALVDNQLGSRIITTTRAIDVAEQVGGAYQLEPLSPNDSIKLFSQIIFQSKDKFPPYHLSEVSQKIMKKCGGIPLAIITIASMLASKKGNEHEYWYRVYRSMGSGLEDGPDLRNMRRILSISYYDLPPHLKTCLLYLSSYPEDYLINRETLIWKWVGEGFVDTKQGRSFHEVGGEYIDELMNKGMIQSSGDIVNYQDCYRVHDMVLDLITSLSNEEQFLTRLDGQQSLSLPKKIRRLSFQTSEEEDIKLLAAINLSHLRSLTVFGEGFSLLPVSPSLCPFLRVMDLSGCGKVDNQQCKDICKLFHLRYLSLSSACITELPKEIANLQFLQVLDISSTEIKELPPTFIQLKQLVYLHFPNMMRLPDGLGSLDRLQEIPNVITIDSPTMLHDLGCLSKLRRLAIYFDRWDESYEKPFIRCLSKLVSLELLEVDGTLGSTCGSSSPGPQRLQSIDMSFCTLTAFPGWISSLCSLSSLHIILLTLGEEDLQVLGSIPSLSDLYISVGKATHDMNRRLVIGRGCPFLCLTQLSISSRSMDVGFAQGAMQKLRDLSLGFEAGETMDEFGDFNFGLENLSSLESVDVWIRCSGAKPREADDAVTAIQRTLHMNPNNPTMEVYMIC